MNDAAPAAAEAPDSLPAGRRLRSRDRRGSVKAALPLVLLIAGVFVIVYLNQAPSTPAERAKADDTTRQADAPPSSAPPAQRTTRTDTGDPAQPNGSDTPAERQPAQRIDNRVSNDPTDASGEQSAAPAEPPQTTVKHGPNYPDTSTRVTMGGETFTLEVAYTNRDRFYGLAGRASIPPSGGMLFAFSDARVQEFVMRDCLVPIDIAFFLEDGTIVQTHTMTIEPRRPGESDALYNARLTRYSSGRPVPLVAEFQAGTLARLGIEPGDKIEGQFSLLISLAEPLP
jgi:uncharacterized membrane protein (UPF0127 family)